MEKHSLHRVVFTYTRTIYNHISGYNNENCCQSHREAGRGKANEYSTIKNPYYRQQPSCYRIWNFVSVTKNIIKTPFSLRIGWKNNSHGKGFRWIQGISHLKHTYIKDSIFNTYPTVVTDTKAHQNPCCMPLWKDFGNVSSTLLNSYRNGNENIRLWIDDICLRQSVFQFVLQSLIHQYIVLYITCTHTIRQCYWLYGDTSWTLDQRKGGAETTAPQRSIFTKFWYWEPHVREMIMWR